MGHLSCRPLLVFHLVGGAALRGGGAWPQLLFTLTVQSPLTEEPSAVPRERLHVPVLESLLVAGSQGPQLSPYALTSTLFTARRPPAHPDPAERISLPRPLPRSSPLGLRFPLGFHKKPVVLQFEWVSDPPDGLIKTQCRPRPGVSDSVGSQPAVEEFTFLTS